jgi:uncharacterized membrane protein
MKIKYLFILGMMLIFSSCYYDKAELLYGVTPVDCNVINAKFSTDINPLIQTKCSIAGCHNSSAAGGLVLLNYTQVKSSIGLIQQRCLVNKDMPPGNPLTKTEMDKLRCWIQAGVQNN